MADYQVLLSRPGHWGDQTITANSKRALEAASILTVEDFAPHRELVSSLLSNRPEFRIIGEVSNGLDAVQKAGELKPDLLLIDIGLPGLNGMEAARRIRELSPSSKIVFLTQEYSPEMVEEAIRMGANGYVFKSDVNSDLLKAVETVMQGDKFFNRKAVSSNHGDQDNQQARR